MRLTQFMSMSAPISPGVVSVSTSYIVFGPGSTEVSDIFRAETMSLSIVELVTSRLSASEWGCRIASI